MKTLLTLLLTVLTGYSATYSGVVSGNNLGNQNSTGTNITIKGLKGWSTNFTATNMTLVGGSFTGVTNTGGVYSGGAYTGTLTGTNAVLTTPSITGGTNTGSIITGATITGSLTGTNAVLTTPSITGGTNTSSIINSPTITGGTVASALTGTNANLTTPIITGATLSGTLSGGTFSGGSFAGSLASTNAVLTTPSVTGGTNSSSLFLNSTLTGFTSSMQTNTDLTASRVLVSDAAQRITNSPTTSTEIGYVSGVTSAIQTQLNAKGSATNGTFNGGTFTGATNANPVVTGQILNAAGTNTAPSYSFLGATGQGMWSGGGTSLLFSVASTERIRVTSDKIGIGSIAPLNTLSVGMAEGAGAYIMGQFPTAGTSGALSAAFFGGGENSGGRAYMRAQQAWNGSFTDTYLDFFTTKGGVGGGTRLTINPLGNVGIGTTSPQYTLDLNGQARILGTNGMRFGGTAGATDDTVRISQSSANNLLLTATTTTTSGDFVVGTKVKITTLTKTADYTLTSTDPGIIFADATGGAVTITLPAASASTIGVEYKVFKVDSSANAVTIAGNGADTLLAGSTTSTTAQANCLKVTGYTSTSWIVNKTQ